MDELIDKALRLKRIDKLVIKSVVEWDINSLS